MKKNNPIVELTMNFAIDAVDFSKMLGERKEFEIRNQFLRSATSIGANVFEAQAAESRADFVHKLKIANKEAYESKFWLILCERSLHLPFKQALADDLEAILRMLNRIISSTKNGRRPQNTN
jgi:four helix bundle protein